MIDQTETQVRVERTVPVGAAALFAVLADPARHVEIDGSGTVQPQVDVAPITGVGQMFTMVMRAPDLGDYESQNHVIGFEPDRRIAWETTRDNKPPPGFFWSWELDVIDADRTRIIHVYDWSRIDDPAVVSRVGFPRVSPAEMNATVTRLVAAARRAS